MAANDKEIVEYIEDSNNDENTSSCKFLLRQVYICSVAWLTNLVGGISYGFPTVMIPQLRKYENSTITISASTDALLKSMFGYGAIPWICISTYVLIVFGRRMALILISLAMLSGFTLLYFMKTTTHILISEILLSSSVGASTSICVIIVTEYAAPKYRSVFLPMKTAMGFWGIWISNSIGAFLPWRYIPLLGIACSLFMLPALFFPETPSWLASKRRFEECRKSHRWLRGSDEDSEREMEKMIKSQEEYLTKRDLKSLCNLKELKKVIKSGEFYKPLLLSIVLCIMYHCSGKLACVVYSIDIIKTITDSEEIAVISMLGLDGISILGMYTGSFISKFVNRRTLLFTTSFIAISFLFILSLYLYLIKLSIISENHFVSITLLTLFSITISSGVILLCSSIFGELVCLSYRSLSMLMISVSFQLIASIILQLSAYLFKHIGLHSAFFFYGVTSSIFTAICYRYLPETKNKTLLEIEKHFIDRSETKLNNSDVIDTLISDAVTNDEIDK